MKRVLVVDGQILVREGICRILDSHPGLRVVGQAGGGREAVDLTEREAPDVVVLEVLLPGLSGVGAAIEIKKTWPDVGIVMLSASADPRYVEDSLRAGAAGYVLKTGAPEELIAAIEAAADGKSYLSPSASESVVDRVIQRDDRRGGVLASLTPREREVLRLIGQGLSAKEVAAALAISVRTVETHRASLMRKLDVHKTSNLIRIAIRENLVTP